mmetsp:Transcript_12398/g.43164  ORF Transcript_12398/g.43164 Transcript_12398/m.43164 type:complete len:154 (+) Transcript_12398:832-1293(+)
MHIDAAPSHLNDRVDEFDTVDKLQQSQRIALAHVDLEVTKPQSFDCIGRYDVLMLQHSEISCTAKPDSRPAEQRLELQQHFRSEASPIPSLKIIFVRCTVFYIIGKTIVVGRPCAMHSRVSLLGFPTPLASLNSSYISGFRDVYAQSCFERLV